MSTGINTVSSSCRGKRSPNKYPCREVRCGIFCALEVISFQEENFSSGWLAKRGGSQRRGANLNEMSATPFPAFNCRIQSSSLRRLYANQRQYQRREGLSKTMIETSFTKDMKADVSKGDIKPFQFLWGAFMTNDPHQAQ